MESIQIVGTTSQLSAKWEPKVGPETLALLDHLRLPEESRSRVISEAVDILASCLPPTAEVGSETGLVVGYVQSGKTMSFTTVTALARDNGYQLVIVIAGTSIPLLQQSTARLRSDLRLDSSLGRKWLPFESRLKISAAERSSIRDALDEWRDPHVPAWLRRTVLITVMKHHRHLDRIIDLLSGINLKGIRALVIDDEADQASLNAKVRQRLESATYRKIKGLRAILPHHTFLEYTATPQAPLLINIIDILAPSFAQVLTPGPDYVGGKDFFITQPQLVEVIPPDDIFAIDGAPDGPPDSLLRALRIFFLGVAAGLVQDHGEGYRSMMVHPSQQTVGHGEYYRWIAETKDSWKEILDPTSSYAQDRKELLESFADDYADLAATVDNLPSFAEITDILHHAIRHTRVQELNAVTGKTPEVRWSDGYSSILIGGQAMDRGFTVEGLTVTYMPRSLGIGNADTVQQRARFFGYKRKYLGYCRVFLEQIARAAYEKYVLHEEDVRKRLLAHKESGAPLSTWKRAFLLNNSLQPTRKSVLDLDYMRSSATSEWFTPRVPHDSDDMVNSNRAAVNAFIKPLNLAPLEGNPARTDYQIPHVRHGVALAEAYSELLTNVRYTEPSDSQEFLRLQLLLQDYLERNPKATCSVFLMSSGKARDRSIDAKGAVKALFQGAAPVSPIELRGTTYPGDQEIRAPGEDITIQIHLLNILDKDGNQLVGDVPALAIHVTTEVLGDIVVQHQPAQEA